MTDRTCAHCARPLPPGCRRNRTYCSRQCTNAAAWARDPEGRKAAHREWRDATRADRAASRLAAKPIRHCEECQSELPREARARRRFCSRRCINKMAVRENLPARVAAYAEWRRRNPDKVAAQRVAYRPKAAEIMRRYYRENPGVFREMRHRRRARKAGAGGPGVLDRDWAGLVARHNGRCAYCRTVSAVTVDHVVPVSRGGAHAIGNVLPACRPCNTSKSDRLLVEWRRHRVRIGQPIHF